MLAILVPFLLGMFQAVASDYHSPRTAGLAGAGHASPSLTDAIWLNPAAVSKTETYNIHLGYNTWEGPNESEPKGRIYGAALLDGRNELFQAGVGFVKRADGQIITLGASKNFIENFGFGIGTKYAYSSSRKPKAKDLSASAMYQVAPFSSVSLMVDNILAGDSTRAWGMEREYILGLKVGLEKVVSLYIDPHLAPALPGSSFGYEAGIELQAMADLFFRIGKSKNSQQPHLERYGRGYGWGIGWIAPKISLDFAMYRSIEPTRTNNTVFSGTIFY